MFLPIGDEPNPRGVPVMNYLLLGANVAVYVLVSMPLMGKPADPNDALAEPYLRMLVERFPGVDPRILWSQVSAYDLFVFEWGYRPANPSLVTLFTSMFLHGGFLHLAGNMLFLWIYGDNVEHRLGKPVYLIVYLLTGVVAAVSFGAFVSGRAGNVPMVGASGAISGVLGLYFLWFPRNRVRVLVFLFPFLLDVWKIGARLVLGFYLVIDNVVPFLIDRQGGGGVAHGAHIGGFVAGVAIAFLADRATRIRYLRRARRVPDEGPPPTPGDASRLEDLLESGRIGRAVRTYTALPPAQRRSVPLDVTVQLADRLTQDGDWEAALALYRRALADHPLDPHRSRAFLGVGQLLLATGRPTAAYTHLLDALDADPSHDTELAARQALARIAAMQKFGRLGR
jgi:membrane associated rhomboid family serine protease